MFDVIVRNFKAQEQLARHVLGDLRAILKTPGKIRWNMVRKTDGIYEFNEITGGTDKRAPAWPYGTQTQKEVNKNNKNNLSTTSFSYHSMFTTCWQLHLKVDYLLLCFTSTALFSSICDKSSISAEKKNLATSAGIAKLAVNTWTVYKADPLSWSKERGI